MSRPHTAGTWQLGPFNPSAQYHTIIGNGRVLAHVQDYSDGNEPFCEEAKANAVLMNEAPSLLNALKSLVDFCEARELPVTAAAQAAIKRATAK